MATDNTPLRVTIRDSPANDGAVLFVHGFGGKPEQTWGQFPSLLAANPNLNGWDIHSLGYPSKMWLDLVGIWKADPSIPILATGLRTSLNLDPLKRYKVLALVAHSMGGLVVQRALVDDKELVKRTQFLFMFGTPSAGLTKAAFFKFWKQTLSDMAEGGSFISELRAKWTQRFASNPPFHLWAVAGDQDQFVPPRSSLGPFADSVRRVVPGSHLTIVKPPDAANLSFVLAVDGLVGNATGPAGSVQRALEYQGFQQTINQLGSTEDLNDADLVKLALAFEGVGRVNDAIRVLEDQLRPGYLDSTSVLAGRLKRRWQIDRSNADWERSRELYAEAFDAAEAAGSPKSAFYPGINIAFLDLAAGDTGKATAMAETVLARCAQVQEPDKWLRATQGEAHLLLGHRDVAIERYTAAANSPSVTPRELDSMYQQATQVAGLLDDRAAAKRLERVFRSPGRP